jgi:hypothetical protein
MRGRNPDKKRCILITAFYERRKRYYLDELISLDRKSQESKLASRQALGFDDYRQILHEHAEEVTLNYKGGVDKELVAYLLDKYAGSTPGIQSISKLARA